MKVCVTGHRPHRLPLAKLDFVQRQLRRKLQELKPDLVLHGAAAGADEMADAVCVELGIEVIRCPGRRGTYSGRNLFMVQQADAVIAVWDGTPGGGTVETMGFASERGLPIHVISVFPAERF